MISERIRSQLRKRRKERLPMEVKRRRRGKRRRREKQQLEKVREKMAPLHRKRKIKRKRRRVELLDSKTTQRSAFSGTGQLKASGSKMPSTPFP